jgi:hypothetical protein
MPTRTKKSSAALEAEIQGILASSQSGHPLTYHAIGGDAERWPAWLRAYGRSCGVYVIRDKSSHRVLYVGSSRAQLYDTITRHFQQWKRKKNYWKGMRGAHHDPGMTYSRARCEVAVRLCSCGEQTEEEAATIKRLRPRDNLVEHPDGELEDAPF